MTGFAGRLYAQPALLLVLTALFWGGNAIAGQLAVGHIGPMVLVLSRWVLVAGVMWALYGSEVIAHWAAAKDRMVWVASMAFLGFTGFNALFYVASHWTSGVNIGILQGSIPVFVILGALAVHGTRIGSVQAVGILVTLAGVVLVATGGDPLQALEIGLGQGDLVMLLACCLYAAYAVLLPNRPAMPGRAFFTLMAPIAALTALPLAVAEVWAGGEAIPTPQGVGVLIFVAIFPSCLAQLFFLRAVDLIGPGKAGVYVNLVPVFAAFLAVALLGQAFAPYHAAALALVLGGIWLAQRAR